MIEKRYAEEFAYIRETVGGEVLPRDHASGCGQSAMKRGIGVVHTVYSVAFAYAFLIEALVVGHERQIACHGFDILPYAVERACVLRVAWPDAMDVLREVAEVEVRLGLHEFIESVGYHSVDYFHRSNGTYGAGIVIGGLDIYGHEIIHGFHQ